MAHASVLDQSQPSAPDSVAQSFLACLKTARHETWPYDHWLLEDPLPQDYCDDIASLPFPPPDDPVFDGRRETNNASRVYFTAENQARFEVCRRLVEGFKDPAVKQTIEAVTAGAADSQDVGVGIVLPEPLGRQRAVVP